MVEKMRQLSQQFAWLTVGLAVISVGLVSFALYQANLISFSNQVSSSELGDLVSSSPEVAAYLETEHENEAHFITIANLIRQQQRQDLANTMLLIILPLAVAAGLSGYLLSRRLLKPVQEAHQSQERFIQDAAHEMRNPLATMSAVLQTAKTAKKSGDRELLKRLERQLNRLVRINEELLFLERLHEPYGGKEVNISEILNDVVEDFELLASEKKIKIETDITVDVSARVSPKDFVRVAKNLIDNAIKYSDSSSKKIAVSLKRTRQGFSLSVKDHGIGIPSKDLANVGERFFRAANVGSTDGTGLGISIVKKVLSSYGGSLEFKSSAKRGTTVTTYWQA